ncbi:MAG: hypothetical protein WDA60_17945 [Acidimicrobiia bacterium]|jgi:hypothetical protein
MIEKPRDDLTDGDNGDEKPAHEPEGPPEIIEAAMQELEYPADETDEG